MFILYKLAIVYDLECGAILTKCIDGNFARTSMGSGNVNGLKNKHGYKSKHTELISEINKHHTACLIETHSGKD